MSVTARLCLMMFLEHAVRGMWYPFLSSYLTADPALRGLGFSDGQAGWVLGFAGAVGGITAPVLAGRVADKYLNAEKALAILHATAAVLLFINASSRAFSTFLLVMIAFSIAYAPTQSLTNSLAITHLTVDRERRFPRVRLWGTIGWIVTSSLFTFAVLTSTDRAVNTGRIPMAMRGAGVLAMFYAAYAFFGLPDTPPADHSAAPLLPWGALKLLREPSVLILSLVAIPVAAIHTAYYLNISPFLTDVVHVPMRWAGPVLALAQVSEVACLWFLGGLLKRSGYTAVLTIGIVAQVVRFVVFAIDPPVVWVCLALTLHGVAFACFTTAATLYIERVSTPAIRHSTQVVFGVILFGVGPALAGPYSQVFDGFKISTPTGPVPDYAKIWWSQAAVAAACAVVTVLFFRPRPVTTSSIEPALESPELPD